MISIQGSSIELENGVLISIDSYRNKK